jgi:PAS domain S-box-containing protein
MTSDTLQGKRAEPAALEMNEYLARLIDGCSDAIISTDKDGNVVLFSERAEALLGYRTKDIAGRNISVLYGDAAGARQVALEMRKRGGTASSLESIMLAKDGTNIPVLISASFLMNENGEELGTIGFVRDLRERKREEDAFDQLGTELRRARERFQYVLTVTPGVIYTTQASGNYACTFVSENVDAVMGFSPWEMVEDPEFWYSRLHPDDARRVVPEMHALIRQGGTTEYRLRNRNKNYIWIRDTFRVINDDAGQPLELVGSWADISYHKQAEEVLGERMAVINDLQAFVAASPAVIYTTTQTVDGYACRFGQREPGIDDRLFAARDARRSEVLVQTRPPRRRPGCVRRSRAADRTGRRNAGVPLPAQARRLHLYPGHVQGHAGKRGKAQGDRRLVGGRHRPQEYRGFVAAAVQRGGATQSIHPRSLWPLSDRRSGVQCARVPHGVGAERRKADGHDDDDRSPRLHSASRTLGARTRRVAYQSLSNRHGPHHQRPYHLFLPETTDALMPLAEAVPLTYEIVEANYLTGESYKGTMTKLSPKRAEVRLEKPVPVLSDLKLQLAAGDGKDVPGALYAKVVGVDPGSTEGFSIRFTSSSPEIETFLRKLVANS